MRDQDYVVSKRLGRFHERCFVMFVLGRMTVDTATLDEAKAHARKVTEELTARRRERVEREAALAGVDSDVTSDPC